MNMGMSKTGIIATSTLLSLLLAYSIGTLPPGVTTHCDSQIQLLAAIAETTIAADISLSVAESRLIPVEQVLRLSLRVLLCHVAVGCLATLLAGAFSPCAILPIAIAIFTPFLSRFLADMNRFAATSLEERIHPALGWDLIGVTGVLGGTALGAALLRAPMQSHLALLASVPVHGLVAAGLAVAMGPPHHTDSEQEFRNQ